MIIHFLVADAILLIGSITMAIIEHREEQKKKELAKRKEIHYRRISKNNPSYEVFRRRAV